MKITMKPEAKPIKQRLYYINPKYKEKDHLELDKMLEAGTIEPVEESDWESPIVFQEKKQKGEIRICVDLRKLNDVYVYILFRHRLTMRYWKMLEGKRPTHSLMHSLGTIRLRSRQKIGEKQPL